MLLPKEEVEDRRLPCQKIIETIPWMKKIAALATSAKTTAKSNKQPGGAVLRKGVDFMDETSTRDRANMDGGIDDQAGKRKLEDEETE